MFTDLANPIVCLTVAGSDSGGGAGIQADIKTFSALGIYAASVVTAITAQNTCEVQHIHHLPPYVVNAQLHAVLADLPVRGIKLGLLTARETIHVLAKHLDQIEAHVVLDPVLVASTGKKLVTRGARAALLDSLLARVHLITPNLPELAHLLGCPVAHTEEAIFQQGKMLLDCGVPAVLIKGGHASDSNCVDWLLEIGKLPVSYSAPRIKSNNLHGTGCTLSSAITANLAKGYPLPEAVAVAHSYLQAALRRAQFWHIGHGQGPLHHFHRYWD